MAGMEQVLPRSCAVSGSQRIASGGGQGSRKRGGLKRPRSRGTVADRGDDVARPFRCRKATQAPLCPAVSPVLTEADLAKLTLKNLPTIVVNLERRPDRMDGCAKRLNLNCPGLQFTRFKATDGRATPISSSEVGSSWHTARNVVYQRIRAVRKGWNDLHTYQERTLELSPGERGCSSSHVRAWRHCLEAAGGTNRPLLVLEDDAAPTPEFAVTLHRALVALPSDAHLLYLGYSQAADWRREVSPELVEAEYVWTTVGYIIWPAGARLLLSRLPVDEPVDNWMAGHNAKGGVKAYCVRPKIIHQAEAWNVNSDVTHSDEHYWGPNSDIKHSDEFYWGAEDPRSKRDKATTGSSFWDVNSEDSEDSADDV